MRFTFYALGLLFWILLVQACNSTQKKIEAADLVILNGNVVTVDQDQPEAEAIAIKNGKIIEVGDNSMIEKYRSESTKVIDAEGQFVMPGFIEGHGHFSGLGELLLNLNLLNTKSWEEIVEMVKEKAEQSPPGEWIEGRGWHQEKWMNVVEPNVLGYPYHDELSAVSPENPVILHHASGHSVFANAKAMEAAGITSETPDPSGGLIVRDNQGKAVGVFEERAEELIVGAHMDYLNTLSDEARKAKWYRGIEIAQEECLSKGITSFQDAGSKFYEIERYKEMAEKSELDLRLWVMVRHPYEVMKGRLDGFPILDVGDHHFTCRAIKSEVDGALGSFGAWLLKPYNDKPGFTGQNTTPISAVESIASLAYKKGMQLCVHAIGDRANREVLNIFEKYNAKASDQESLRWRVEHAQHLDTSDIPRFKSIRAIASMQGIHCTSDAPFVEKRLGSFRARTGAYAWRSLLDAGVPIANGTDVPVEDVDPIENFYASVTRKRIDNAMAFYPEQRMTREEAVYSYTLGNAYAAFEEKIKGSITKGKLADIVILSEDLLKCSDEDILNAKVLYTIVGGEVKYQRNK